MLLSNLNLLATAPGGVAKLRELILTLAVQGTLVPQNPKDEPASVLLKKIRAEKDRLIAEGKIKRDKPLTEIAEEEKPFALPEGWEWVRLGTVTNISTGKLDANAAVANGQYPFFTCSNTPLAIDRYSFECSAVLLAGNGDFNLKHYTGKFDAYQRTYVIQPILTNLKFLYFTLNKYIGVLTKNQRGSAIPYLKLGDITDPPIPIPPLAEQSRIVTRVEELMRLCDALEAKGQLEATQHAQLVSTLLGTLTESETPEELADNWQRVATHFDLLLDRPEAVDALEQTILQLAVRGLLVPQDPKDESTGELLTKIRGAKDKLIVAGKIKRDQSLLPIAEDEEPYAIPTGWKWVRLGDVSKVISGYAFSSEDLAAESGIRAIKITNAGVGEFHETEDYLPPRYNIGFDNFKAAKNDLILALTRPYVSNGLKISRCPTSYEGALINQRVAAIRCSSVIVHEFAFAYMQSADVLRIYQNRFNGSGLQPNLKVADVTELALPLPPLAEQFRIVVRVAQLRRLCADLRQRLTAVSERQSQLAQTLVEMQSTSTV